MSKGGKKRGVPPESVDGVEDSLSLTDEKPVRPPPTSVSTSESEVTETLNLTEFTKVWSFLE